MPNFYAFAARAKRFAAKSNDYYPAAWQRSHGTVAELKTLPSAALGSQMVCLFPGSASPDSKWVDQVASTGLPVPLPVAACHGGRDQHRSSQFVSTWTIHTQPLGLRCEASSLGLSSTRPGSRSTGSHACCSCGMRGLRAVHSHSSLKLCWVWPEACLPPLS